MRVQKIKIPVISLQMIALLALLVGALLLTACRNKGGEHAKSGQTIARVNGDEITLSQLNYELRRARVSAEQQDAAAKQIVQGLVDRQLVTQAAINAKLDRNPGVLQAIENAKAMVLVQAYLETKSAGIAKPADAEISDYYNKHTDLFANRKVYVMDELALAADAYSKELNDVANKAKSLDEITAWLDSNGVKYNHTQATHASEAMPEPLRVQLLKMKVGDILFVRAQEGNIIDHIQAIKDAPVSEADAKPFIERGLLTEKRKAAAEAEMKALRDAAKIVYLDDKYKMGAVAANQPAAPKPADPELAPNAKPETKPVDSHIQKGLSGL